MTIAPPDPRTLSSGTRVAVDGGVRTTELDDGVREVEAKICSYGVGPDTYRTTWAPGWAVEGLRETLGDGRADGPTGTPVTMVYGHDERQINNVIGSVAGYEDRPDGLYVRMRMANFDEVPSARIAYSLIRDGHLRGWSFKYRDADLRPDPAHRGALQFVRARLVHVSPVTDPSIPGTATVGVRSHEEEGYREARVFHYRHGWIPLTHEEVAMQTQRAQKTVDKAKSEMRHLPDVIHRQHARESLSRAEAHLSNGRLHEASREMKSAGSHFKSLGGKSYRDKVGQELGSVGRSLGTVFPPAPHPEQGVDEHGLPLDKSYNPPSTNASELRLKYGIGPNRSDMSEEDIMNEALLDALTALPDSIRAATAEGVAEGLRTAGVVAAPEEPSSPETLALAVATALSACRAADVPDEQRLALIEAAGVANEELCTALGVPTEQIRAAQEVTPKDDDLDAIAEDDGTRAAGDKPYGDVEYADPGYQADKQKRYPIDTEEHVRAALSYIGQKDNSSKYDPEDLKKVKDKIAAAAKKFGIGERSAEEIDEALAKLDRRGIR